MKNKIIISFFLLLLFISCGPSKQEFERQEREKLSSTTVTEDIRIITIDGCEYILYDSYSKGGICHKANCKNKIHNNN